MTGEAQPQDVAADFLKLLETPGGTSVNGASQGATQEQTQTDAVTGDEFADAPTDPPSVLALKRQLRGTMTKRTTEIATERKQIADERKALAEAQATLNALRSAADPAAAAAALFGKQMASGPQRPNLEAIKAKFDNDTWEAINAIVDAKQFDLVANELAPVFAPVRDGYRTLLGDRSKAEEAQVVAKYGSDVSTWMEAARTLQKQANGVLTLDQALNAVSGGQVAITQLRAQVMEKRKREAIPPALSDQASTKIKLTRDDIRANMVKAIMEKAAEAGNEQFSRL